MRNVHGLAGILSILALGLSACSDDAEDVPVGPVDAGSDVTASDQYVPDTSQPDVSDPDVQADTTPDVTPDVAPDVVPDTVEVEADSPEPPPSGTIQVLTINDFHGQLDSMSVKDSATGITSYYGGLGYISTYFRQERAANPNTIILNGGDEVGASPALSAYGTDIRDEPTVRALNFLGLDASNIGNHNFDQGPAHLKTLMEIAEYDYIGTNINDAQNELGSKLVKPYTMLEFGTTNPIKVAIIGISNPETPAIVVQGNMGNVTINEPVAAANAAAAAARAAGAHVVLVTAHIGATGVASDGSGAPIGPLVDFASNLDGVDFVQGGHTEAKVEWLLGDVFLVQGESRVKAYNRVVITVTDGKVTNFDSEEVEVLGMQIAPAEGGGTCPTANCPAGFTCTNSKCQKDVVTADPAATTLIQPWKDGLAVKFDQKIGTIDQVFVRDGAIERTQEVPLGDLAADAILEAYKPYGVQIAFMNGGGIRDSLPSAYTPQAMGLVRTGCSTTTPCDLVLGDVYTVLPFSNAVVVREVPGSLLWEIVEWGLSTLPVPHGRFLQMAGLKIVYKKSEAPGARIQSMTYYGGGTDVDIPSNDTTLYTIAVNDFMNGGGDGYVMLKEPWPTPSLGLLSDAVADYVKKVVTITTPMPNDRIIALE